MVEDDFNHIVHGLYEGVVCRDAWHEALDLLTSQVGSAFMVFGRADFHAGEGRLWSHRADPDIIALSSGPLASPDVNPIHRAMPFMCPGKAVRSTDLVPEETLRASRFSQELLEPFSLKYGLGSVIERDGRGALFGAIWRERGSRDFTDREIALLETTIPHIGTALSLRARIREEEAAHHSLADVLRAIEDAAILIDGGQRIVHANPAAEEELCRTDLLRQEDGVLAPASRFDGPPLSQAIVRAQTAGRPVNLRLARRAGGSTVVELRALAAPEHRDHVLVIVPHRPARVQAERLIEAYGLTLAEARLASLLAEGTTPSDAARELGVSINTVKSQRSHVFARLGVSRQAQLVRRLADDRLI